MENVDSRIIAYTKIRKNGELTTEGFKASINGMSLSAKAGKAALQTLATAGNIAAGIFISFAATKAIELIDNFVHREKRLAEAFENAKQSTDSYKSSLQNIQNEIQKNKEAANEIVEVYAKPAQRVNTFTNENN